MTQKEKYEKYLKSEKWANKRNKKAKEQSFTCEICGEKIYKGFHIHHKTYKNLGNEPLTDLMFLCEDCHILIHKRINDKKIENKKTKIIKCCGTCYRSVLEVHKNSKVKNQLYCWLKNDCVDYNYYCRQYKKGTIKNKTILSSNFKGISKKLLKSIDN